MQQLITFIHILVAICVIALVLIQRGKGSDIGASFGSGASQTMFGSQGSTPFLVKLTAILAMLFFITSSVLSFMVGKQVQRNNLFQAPTTTETSPSVPPIQSIQGGSAGSSQPTIPAENVTPPGEMSKMPEKNTPSPLPSSSGKTHN